MRDARRGAAATSALVVLLLPAMLGGCSHPAKPATKAAEPVVTATGMGTPADPINIELVGTREDVIAAMTRSGWNTADMISIVSSVHMLHSVLWEKEYPTAPMSRLYLFGRSQDLAFQRTEGSARRRHHVRLWVSERRNADGRPIWVGSAIYDTGVGTTKMGKLIHRIDGNIDAERDTLISDLRRNGQVVSLTVRKGIGVTVNGKNATGDTYFTDGQVRRAVLVNYKPSEADAVYLRHPASPEADLPPLTAAKPPPKS